MVALALSLLFGSPLDEPAVEIRCDRSRGVVLCRELPVEEGGLLVGEVSGCADPAVRWLGQSYSSFPVSDSQWHALLPVPLNSPIGAHLLQVSCEGRLASFVIHVVRGAYESSELRVSRRFSKPPPPRVDGERTAIAEALRSPGSERLWSRRFSIPRVDEITSPFGTRRVFNEVLQSQHRGLDIDGRKGTPIIAANDGQVVLVADNFFYVGNAVFIHHGQQLYTMYFHMNEVDVRKGQAVRRGQRIGSVGRTGRVTGPHLHFSVKLRGWYIDPVDVLAYRPEPLREPLMAEGKRITSKLGRR